MDHTSWLSSVRRIPCVSIKSPRAKRPLFTQFDVKHFLGLVLAMVGDIPDTALILRIEVKGAELNVETLKAVGPELKDAFETIWRKFMVPMSGDWVKFHVTGPIIESPLGAVERSIARVMEWSESTGQPWTDYFRKVNANAATHSIEAGSLSLWFYALAPSWPALRDRLSKEQYAFVEKSITPEMSAEFNSKPDAVAEIRALLEEFGI